MSFGTHMITWLISRAFSRAVTYHTSDDVAFPEAEGLYSAMSYVRILLYDYQNLKWFIQGVWFDGRSRFALLHEGSQLQHYILLMVILTRNFPHLYYGDKSELRNVSLAEREC